MEEVGSGRADLQPGFYRLIFEDPQDLGASMTIPLLVLGGTSVEIDYWARPKDAMTFLPGGPFVRSGFVSMESTPVAVWADVHEVTIGEWLEFLDAVSGADPGAYRSPEERAAFGDQAYDYGDAARFEGRPKELPVDRVNWYDALAFAMWRTEVHGGGRVRFRLPTALEWEKLCCGVDGRLHPWGSHVMPVLPGSGLHDGLVEVETFRDRASPYGALHMESNVAEWVMDAADSEGRLRLIMGKSASIDSSTFRAFVGAGEEATRRSSRVGFRLIAERL